MPIESKNDPDFDAVIVGGSFAGLSAAMQLARARRRICVVDAGAPRNRFSPASHGFFGQDGLPPLEMIARARDMVLAYPGVQLRRGVAATAGARPDGAGFTLELADGERLSARKLVLAFGVRDTLPPIEGLAPRWGVSVLHCPYCHGYEYADRALGLLYESAAVLERAQLIAQWGPTTLFLNGHGPLDAAEMARLAALGIAVEPGRIARLEGEGTALAAVRLEDGRAVPVDALFRNPSVQLGNSLAEQLGCAVDDGPTGPLVRTDALKRTTVPGVHAAGDLALMGHSATLASADGVMAGISVHRALVYGE